MSILSYSSWFNNYPRENIIENAAILEIDGYVMKNGKQDIRGGWYSRTIYPDGEDNVIADQEGNCLAQEITYARTPEGLSRATTTYDWPRNSDRELLDVQTELLPRCAITG